MNFIGYAAGFLTLLIFVPQSIKTIKTKKTKDLSLLSFLIVFTSATLWVIYGLSLHRPAIWVANTVVAIMSFVILTYKIRYK